jgi:hypothetical protein
VSFIALGAAALAIGIAAWTSKRLPTLRVIAVLLALDALVFVFAEALDMPSASLRVALWIGMLVISLATMGTVAALAFTERKPLVIAGAVSWTLWWILDAMFFLWVIQTTVDGSLESSPPGFGIVPYLAGAAAALLVAIAALAHAKQPGAIALVAVLAGFLIVWCLGEAWLMSITVEDDVERIASLRQFRNVGYVGWHVVLAVLLWRIAQGNLPRARVVTG